MKITMSQSEITLKYSVLMSVYQTEKPKYLKESIDSLLNQTVKPSDFVLVEDGLVSNELEKLICDYEKEYPNLFQVIRLPENLGTGGATNKGLMYCKNEIVVKMDSDDICLPNRCEEILKVMQENPHIGIVGSYIEEFEDETYKAIAIKKTPIENDDIRHFAKRRNPFNNQSIAYKKSEVLKVGGYSDLRRCEDYDLIIRLIQNGIIGKNIPLVLVRYRVNKYNYEKRRNFANTKAFIKVRYRIYKSGYSSLWDFVITTIAQLVLFIAPTKLVGKIYKTFLRK